MKIAILYICTGKYSGFWRDFYTSSQRFFLNDIEKHYFVFTDDNEIKKSDNVTVIYKEYRGYPLDTLLRFEMFWSVKEKLSAYNYIYFFNANMLFVDNVGVECLPDINDGGLVALIHPALYNKPARFLPYERNKKSLAYIPHKKQIYTYYMGSLNGGITEIYLDLVKKCMDNIQIDYDNGIIAIVLDESHLNRYLFDHKVLGLSPSYGYPEGYNIPFHKKILMLDKVKVDPSFSIHPSSESFVNYAKRKLIRLYRILFW